MPINLDKILQSNQLPSLPTVAVRLLKLSSDPEASITDIAATIKSDPAIAAKVLRMANSPRMALSREVTSLDQAICILGTNVLTSLTLSFSLASASVSDGQTAERYRAYWLRCTVQAVAAEIMGRSSKEAPPADFFLCGLLCDVGQLAMLKAIPKEYAAVLDAVRHSKQSLLDVEGEKLGIQHVAVGLRLAEKWSLPASVKAAVRLHHAPIMDVRDYQEGDCAERVKATALAAAVGTYFAAESDGRSMAALQRIAQELYGMTDDTLTGYLSLVREEAESMGSILDIDTDDLPDTGDLLAQANELLAELSLQAETVTTQALADKKALEEANEDLVRANMELKHQAIRDALTGVYNRSFFDEFFRKEIQRSVRHRYPVAVVFCDIDRFKQLNDTNGHQFGDHVLCQVAASLNGALRANDIIARYGGEEFVAIAVNADEHSLEHVGERLRATVETLEIIDQDQRVPVTVSIGIASAQPQPGQVHFGRWLLEEADQAMYDSKQNGRNQVHVRQPEYTSTACGDSGVCVIEDDATLWQENA